MPESLRAACKQIRLPTGNDINADANKDIHYFFKSRFAELGGSWLPDWPIMQILDMLTTRAAGLFVWAEMVMRFVERGLPDEQLRLVLAGSSRRRG